jgi:hypothetical protein
MDNLQDFLIFLCWFKHAQMVWVYMILNNDQVDDLDCVSTASLDEHALEQELYSPVVVKPIFLHTGHENATLPRVLVYDANTDGANSTVG